MDLVGTRVRTNAVGVFFLAGSKEQRERKEFVFLKVPGAFGPGVLFRVPPVFVKPATLRVVELEEHSEYCV